MPILNGKKIAEKIIKGLKKNIEKNKTKPGLAVILVGRRPDSLIYVKLKQKKCEEIGINFKKFTFPTSVSQKKLIKLIEKLNQDKKIHGLIIQFPVPKKLNYDRLIKKISSFKDVDGFGPKTKFVSPLHQSIVRLIKQSSKKLKNKQTIILGNSQIFTQPLKDILSKKGARVKIILFKKQRLTNQIKKADILIVSLGIPNFIKPSMIKKNSVIIDIGFNRIKGKSIGDVDPGVSKKTPYLSPVPGGVGPLTVAYLLKNVYSAFQKTLKK